VRTGNIGDVQVLRRGFRSNAARGNPPRPGTVEETTPFVYNGISAYDTQESAIAHARERRDLGKPIGSYVATLTLNPNEGFEYAYWGAKGHLTLAGDPIKLQQAVTDIVPI
jgi:hypothetical protein